MLELGAYVIELQLQYDNTYLPEGPVVVAIQQSSQTALEVDMVTFRALTIALIVP